MREPGRPSLDQNTVLNSVRFASTYVRACQVDLTWSGGQHSESGFGSARCYVTTETRGCANKLKGTKASSGVCVFRINITSHNRLRSTHSVFKLLPATLFIWDVSRGDSPLRPLGLTLCPPTLLPHAQAGPSNVNLLFVNLATPASTKQRFEAGWGIGLAQISVHTRLLWVEGEPTGRRWSQAEVSIMPATDRHVVVGRHEPIFRRMIANFSTSRLLSHLISPTREEAQLDWLQYDSPSLGVCEEASNQFEASPSATPLLTFAVVSAMDTPSEHTNSYELLPSPTRRGRLIA
ncbi:unnamed protein product [Protopolystoma xenopodis]|uniref:Uncharacterized protein n=1 Tax=Protopolystoma xenopodis TaxID=117903 RepID=A0A3S5CFZ8_9PLAT|nr:unnamed protein product [Protopolystoma xenopodis]